MENLYFEATGNAMMCNSPWEENGRAIDIKDISRAVTVIPQISMFKSKGSYF